MYIYRKITFKTNILIKHFYQLEKNMNVIVFTFAKCIKFVLVAKKFKNNNSTSKIQVQYPQRVDFLKESV